MTPIPPTLLRLFIDGPGGRLARHLFLTFRQVWHRSPEMDRRILLPSLAAKKKVPLLLGTIAGLATHRNREEVPQAYYPGTHPVRRELDSVLRGVRTSPGVAGNNRS
jgi:hypothetical protein